MHEYIKSHQEIFKNKKLLEISCGCGLVSFTLSLINVQLVIATELDDILNNNTKKNLLLNNLENEKNIQLIPLEWGNKEDLNHLFTLYPNFDILIISECLYEDAPFDKLLITLIKLCKFYKNIEVYFTYKKRYIFQDICIEKLKKYFTIEDIDRNEIHKDFRNINNYQFFKLKLINN